MWQAIRAGVQRRAACTRRSPITAGRCGDRAPSNSPWVVVPLRHARRAVHERPFAELPVDVHQSEAYNIARDALLQLNIMVRRGIEPDVLMYTSLIHTMGRAGLEWQAYKLFSRMIEQNVRPLPETYVALRDATAKSRVQLRADIQARVEEALETYPQELARVEQARRKEEDAKCVAKFHDYMRGELPALAPPAPASSLESGDATHSARQPESPADVPRGTRAAADAAHASELLTRSAAAESHPVSTMHIRHPVDAWNTAKHAEELRGAPQQRAAGDAALELRTALHRLHEEELRIFLTAQRQLRHGDKTQLVDRILSAVGERAIRAMLHRRDHYFRSVESILAADLRALKMSAPASSAIAAAKDADGEPHAALAAARVRGLDRATRRNRDIVGPDVLHAPWGLLRRPLRLPAEAPAARSAERLQRVRLSDVELLLVRQRAEENSLDELPESLLRRYAFQMNLRWRRRVPQSLLEAVQWHVLHFFPPDLLAGGRAAQLVSPAPTPAIRLRQAATDAQQTLDNFEAFRVIAQRTNNLQVVDNKEINAQLKRAHREALRRDRRAENDLRREEHVLAAAGLAASARSYDPPPVDDAEEGGSRVLGWGGPSPGSTPAPPELPSTTADGAEELPPWELCAGEEEFDLTTGRFGRPEEGRYQELGDSSFRVLPSRAAQQRWLVDRPLMPSALRDVVEEAELEQERRHEAIEKTYLERLQYTKYRKWDHLLRRAQEQRRQQKETSKTERPLPPRQRLAQLLRKGKDKQPVSDSIRAKYSKSL